MFAFQKTMVQCSFGPKRIFGQERTKIDEGKAKSKGIGTKETPSYTVKQMVMILPECGLISKASPIFPSFISYTTDD